MLAQSREDYLDDDGDDNNEHEVGWERGEGQTERGTEEFKRDGGRRERGKDKARQYRDRQTGTETDTAVRGEGTER